MLSKPPGNGDVDGKWPEKIPSKSLCMKILSLWCDITKKKPIFPTHNSTVVIIICIRWHKKNNILRVSSSVFNLKYLKEYVVATCLTPTNFII